MNDPVGRRKALVLALVLLVSAAVGFWFLRREPAEQRCARIAHEETAQRLRAAAAEVTPPPGSDAAPLPTPSDMAWYQKACREGKPQ